VLPTRSSAPKPLSNPTSEVRSGAPVTFIEATTVLAKQWSDLPKSATHAEDDAATASQPQNSEASTWPAVNATHAGTQELPRSARMIGYTLPLLGGGAALALIAIVLNILFTGRFGRGKLRAMRPVRAFNNNNGLMEPTQVRPRRNESTARTRSDKSSSGRTDDLERGLREILSKMDRRAA